MAGGQQQQQQGGDTSLGPFWMVVGAFALAWGIWYFAHEQISVVLLHIKLYEAEFISYFFQGANGLVEEIKNTAPGDASFQTLSDISVGVGNILRFPVIIILVIFAALIYFGKASVRYKKTYHMKTLVADEKESWPQISPIANVDLVNTNIDEGPWAMALTPMQFAKKNALLQEEHILASETTVGSRKRIIVNLRREEAFQTFALQVGRYWTGIDDLNKHTKALFAVFAARADRDQEGATNLLLQIAGSTIHEKLDFSGTEELLEKHRHNKGVLKVIEKHAFVMTTMASMLLLAREDGVLASADFLWLKVVDRPLWYMLNSVGRQTPFVEIAGPFAHWLAERSIGRKLSVPMVEEAVNALDAALKEVIYVPDE